MKRSWGSPCELAGLVAVLLAVLVPIGAAGGETIKIGSFLAVSGPAAFLGDPEKKTLELYVERINAAGGVLGKRLDLVLYDTGMDAKQAVTLAKRLVEQDRVDVLIGGTTTGETMAVIQAVNPQLPFVSLAGASVVVEPVKKWVFKTPHTDRMAVDKVFQDMKAAGITRIGLIAGDGGFDKSCTSNAAALAPKHGLTVAASETYGKGDTDVTPQLIKIRNAEVQGTLFCGFGAPSTIVTKNYAQLALKARLYHNHGSCSKQFVQGAGTAAEGVRLPCAALLVASQLAQSDPQRAVTLDYVKTYRARYNNEDVSTFGGHAYDALLLVVDAIKRAGSADPDRVRSALEQTKELVGTDGIFTLSPQDHMGLDLRSLRMVEVRNGDWKLVD